MRELRKFMIWTCIRLCEGSKNGRNARNATNPRYLRHDRRSHGRSASFCFRPASVCCRQKLLSILTRWSASYFTANTPPIELVNSSFLHKHTTIHTRRTNNTRVALTIFPHHHHHHQFSQSRSSFGITVGTFVRRTDGRTNERPRRGWGGTDHIAFCYQATFEVSICFVDVFRYFVGLSRLRRLRVCLSILFLLVSLIVCLFVWFFFWVFSVVL